MSKGNAPEFHLGQAALLGAFGILAILAEAAPLGLAPTAQPSPDLLFGIIAYWAARRPDATPILLVATLGLLRDLLTDVPVGAGALTLTLASEFLRAQSGRLARTIYPFEWLIIAGVAAAMLLAQWAMVLVTLAQPPYLSYLAMQWIYTVSLIPVIALILRWLFGIRAKTAKRRTTEN